jgi:hypothetical protein
MIALTLLRFHAHWGRRAVRPGAVHVEQVAGVAGLATEQPHRLAATKRHAQQVCGHHLVSLGPMAWPMVGRSGAWCLTGLWPMPIIALHYITLHYNTEHNRTCKRTMDNALAQRAAGPCCTFKGRSKILYRMVWYESKLTLVSLGVKKLKSFNVWHSQNQCSRGQTIACQS